MLRFLNGHLMGTTSSAGTAGDAGAGGGGGAGDNAAFVGSLPEPLRANPAFKEVKDVGDLATRYADLNKPFADRLPEKIRGEAYFKDIKDFDSLATKAFNQAKLIGHDPERLAVVPGDENKDAWNEFYARAGRPEKATDYKIPPLGDGKDYSEADKAMQGAILPVLHEAGLSQRQIAAIVPKWNEIAATMNKAQDDAQQQAMEEASGKLKTEMGTAYDEKLGLAESALKHLTTELKLDPKQVGAELERTGLGNNPALFKIFAHIGGQLKEDGLLGKDEGGAAGALTPTEAKQHLNAFEAENKDALTNKRHPQHADALQKRAALYEQAYPTAEA